MQIVFPAIQFETQCSYAEATIQDFVDWEQQKESEDNPLLQFSADKHWIYMDYKYMAKIFEDQPQQLKVSFRPETA